MKNSLIILLLMAAVVPARAQKIIEKHIDLAANGNVTMNFQISDSIRIITWKKNEVFIRSSIDANDNQDNDDYKMNFEGSGSSVVITGKLERKEGHTGRHVKDSAGKQKYDKDDDCCCYCNYNTEIVHVVYLPETADFSVETINGNIVISGNTAAITAKSISGYIDVAMDPAKAMQVKLETITGTMYSNFDISAGDKNLRWVGGRSVSTELNGGGGKRIELKTISGDIFFRKQG
jgi:hypothetical protein